MSPHSEDLFQQSQFDNNKQPSSSTINLLSLAIDLLAPSPFQPRRFFNPEQLEELAQSIQKSGVLQPILARPNPQKEGTYQIIAGERRWRAAQKAGLHVIPVHIIALNDTEAMTAALVENLQRADLDPMEEAEGLQRLLYKYHFTQEDLAKLIGKSRAHLTNTLRLLNAPDKIKHALKEKKISAGHARALLNHPHPLEALEKIITHSLNVRQAEALAQKAQKNHKKPKNTLLEKECDNRALEEKLSQELGLKISLKFNGKSGSLKIDYHDLDQLDDLINRLKSPKYKG